MEEMERDPAVLLMGEDIGVYGGAFAVTTGLLDRFGPDRVLETPISENSFVGVATGAAIGGLRPVVEIMFMDFLALAADQIINHAAKLHYIYGGQVTVPMVIRTPCGGGRGYGASHSQCLEAMFMGAAGLKIVAPSNPYDAKGMLKSAIRYDGPVLFVEHKLLYGMKGAVPDDPGFVADLARAAIRRPGKDVSIVAHSRMVSYALEAADLLAGEGIDAEVVDLRVLKPLDEETLLGSVARTGKAVLVEEGNPQCGITAEVAALIAEKALSSLDGRVLRVGAADVPIPSAIELERQVLPAVRDIVEAAKRSLSF